MATDEQSYQGDPFNPSPHLLTLLAAKMAGKGDSADDATLEAWAKAHRTTSGVKDEEEAED